MSGSVHPKLVGEWLAEFYCVTCVDDLDRSGFAFDTDRMEFEPLESKIVQGMVKTIPREFTQEKDQFVR